MKKTITCSNEADEELLRHARKLINDQIKWYENVFAAYPKVVVRITNGVSKKDEEEWGNLKHQTFIKQGDWYRPFPLSSCPQLAPWQKQMGLILLGNIRFVIDSQN